MKGIRGNIPVHSTSVTSLKKIPCSAIIPRLYFLFYNKIQSPFPPLVSFIEFPIRRERRRRMLAEKIFQMFPISIFMEEFATILARKWEAKD